LKECVENSEYLYEEFVPIIFKKFKKWAYKKWAYKKWAYKKWA